MTSPYPCYYVPDDDPERLKYTSVNKQTTVISIDLFIMEFVVLTDNAII
jgi:hypothetical protein